MFYLLHIWSLIFRFNEVFQMLLKSINLFRFYQIDVIKLILWSFDLRKHFALRDNKSFLSEVMS